MQRGELRTVASISPNLESKSGAPSPQFWALVPPISDLSFLLYFGLLSPLKRKFCQKCKLKIGGRKKRKRNFVKGKIEK